MKPNPWTIQQNTATLSLGEFSAEIDLARPQQGIVGIRFGGEKFATWSLWQVDDAALGPPFDAYLRDNDLVATYERTPERPLRVQIYWRALPNAADVNATGIEMIVSVQTDLLDFDPRVRLTSRFGNAVGHVMDDFALCRARRGRVTFAYLIGPGDPSQIELSTAVHENGATIQTTLFAHHLEKGVILRSRMRGYFIDRSDDEAVARHLSSLFSATEPVLTA